MKKKALIFLLVFTAGLLYLFASVPSLSKQHGMIKIQLYLGESPKRPLTVAFGGGCNDCIRDYLKGKRNSLIQQGFAVLAVGYFNIDETPDLPTTCEIEKYF